MSYLELCGVGLIICGIDSLMEDGWAPRESS